MSNDVNTMTQAVGDGGMTPEQIAEHEQNMANVADAEANKGTPDADLILGKFKSQDDLAAAYKNLESEMGKLRNAPQTNDTDNTDTSNTDTNTNTETDNTDNPLDIKKAEEAPVTLDQVKLSEEYYANGKAFTEETIANFEKQGISKDMLDTYAKGLEAQIQLNTNAVYESVGGQENFNVLKDWASTNLSDSELNVYSEALASNDVSKVNMILSGIKARYEAVNGTGFKQTNASSASGSQAPESFKSAYEMTQAMADPRYTKDPAYRMEVEQKVMNSKF